jgi:hypothetical protein
MPVRQGAETEIYRGNREQGNSGCRAAAAFALFPEIDI